MKIALVAANSRVNQVEENLNTLFDAAREAKKQGAGLALLGEAFLQGFEAMTFDYKTDIHKCLGQGSQAIARILAFAKAEGIALGLGYYENDHGAIYASYLLVGDEGQVLANYRRVSPGWKEPGAHADYRCGTHFLSVNVQGKELALMLCGDFWEDGLLSQILEMDDRADAFLWPVHCDYDIAFWEASEEAEYRRRSELLAAPVLMINNYTAVPGCAKGGLYHWHLGGTLAKADMGREAMLIVEI
ncbi:MAG: carbon-nitrogen hydrolase family protein [Clostridiales bacterium]|nr:carbon-nitrogen hydrolase family protein [Clostridiales bacterium]